MISVARLKEWAGLKAGNPYSGMTDDALLALIFSEGDRLPMDFAREAISRGERLVPRLTEVALTRHNWGRSDSGWSSAFHACFILGAIGGGEATQALLEAFDISEDVEHDWVSDKWASIFGSLGPAALEGLKDKASQMDADPFWRHRALCGMAAVALRHPERRAEVFSFIARVAADLDDDPDARVWAGNVLLDFRLKEHEALLLALAELPENDVYHADTVRESLSKEPDLHWYQHDWLEFYSPEELSERRERWEEERLSEEEAWQWTVDDQNREEDELPPLSRKQAEKQLGDLLSLARKAEETIEFHTAGLSKEELLRQYVLAMELHEAIRQDGSRYRLFNSYLEDLLGWLTSLAMNMAAEGLVDEAARLGLAWADIREPEIFLGDRAVILAEAGREAASREQLDRNLKLFARDLWVQIKAGDSYAALKDWPAAEERYRLAKAMAETEDDRSAILDRMIRLFRDAGKNAEADALEAKEQKRLDAQRHREQEARARWTPVVRQGPKIGRNDPCPCGSGKKYKKCCLGRSDSPARPGPATS
jgi:hypothetical protein